MIAVIDTSVLITFYKADKVNLLVNLYKEVYIPRNVEEEFLQKEPDARLGFLLPTYELNTWLKPCQTYDPGMLKLLATTPKMDLGESEVIAQMKQIQLDLNLESETFECLIDEKVARKVALRMDLPVKGALRLLARLHFLGYLDFHSTVEPIAKERRFAPEIIDEAFRIAEEEALGGQK